MRKLLGACAVVVLGSGVGGCKPRVCATVLYARMSPSDTTIPVGGVVAPRLLNSRLCTSLTDPDSYWDVVATNWFTSDSAAVRLDTVSGQVTGRAKGDAVVRARADASHSLQLAVHVR